MDSYRKAWDKLLKGSVFPWWEWHIPDNTVRNNDLKVTLLGLDPKDFKGKGYEAFTDRVHPDDYEKTMAAMRRVLRGETNLYQVDYRIRTADDDYMWFMDRGIVIERRPDGRPLIIRGVVIDLGRRSTKKNDVETLIDIFRNSSMITRGRSSFISVCSVCHKIKRDENHWVKMPHNISDLLAEKISHGICPSCIKDLYPDIADKIIEHVYTETKTVNK
jgi:hypothetical protein